jgi:hypothetical protein
MVKLQPLLEVRLLADPEDLERASLDDWQHTYQMDWTRFAYTDDGQFSAEWSVHVLQKTLVLRGGRVVGDGAFLSLEEVAGMLPAVPASEREARAAPARGDVPTDVFVQYPWLIDYLTWGPKPGETAVGREAAADRGGGGGDRVPHLDAADVNAEAVMDALHARRLEWHALDRAANVDFMVTICGGRWTMINLGVAYDCFKAEGRTREATEFCQRFRFNKSRSYNISTYGEGDASTLAHFWKTRMQFLFDRWMDACEVGGGLASPGDVDLSSWDDGEYVRMLHLHGNQRVKDCIGQVRGLSLA